MKIRISPLLISSLLCSFGAHAKMDVIYGEDNRREVFESSPELQVLARSAATMIGTDKMTTVDGLISIEQKPFGDMFKMKDPASGKDIVACADMKYTEQPNAGMCSGFLIAPDILMTAGHCVSLENFCEKFKWVFDFKVDEASGKAGLGVKPSDIYSCKKVISNNLNMTIGLDYGLVLLDRRVEGRAPLKLRHDKSISVGEEILVIGSPSGLPLKVADGANVRSVANPFFFSANLDTFSGNSGSAVFNARTGIVEGILVRGEDDFAPNKELMCIEAKKCKNDECRGEDVSRVTSAPEISIQKMFNLAAERGDVETIKEVLSLNTWVDFSNEKGETALMKAVQGNNLEVVKLLVAAGADPKREDAGGISSLMIAEKAALEEILKLFK